MSIFSMILLVVAGFFLWTAHGCRNRNPKAADGLLDSAILLIIAAGVWK